MAAKNTVTLGVFEYSPTTVGGILDLAATDRLRPWEYNRGVDRARVARMYAEQVNLLRVRGQTTLFTPVPIVVYSAPGEPYTLLDGQHRLEVMRLLTATNPGLRASQLLLCVARGPVPTAHEVFERVNSGTPVPAAYYNQKVNDVLTQYTASLEVRFPAAISKAPHPHRPNINLGRVREEMSAHLPFRDAIIDGLIAPADLLELTLRENDVETVVSQSGPRSRTPASAVERAGRTHFHLGLRDGWAVALASAAAKKANDAVVAALPP